MSKWKDSPLEIVLEEVRAAGLEPRVDCKRHAKVWFTASGTDYCYVTTVNGKGANRARRNARAGIRRLLRQAGALD